MQHALATPADGRVVGSQEPRILVRPDVSVGSAAGEVIDLCDMAGLVLDPWQRLCLDVILTEADGGKVAASTAALIVPRQNGKGSVLEALELGWLFLFDIPFISHSAHLFNTSQEAFTRLLTHIDGNDWLRRRVKKVSAAHGKEGLTTMSGSRLKFMARTGGSGRGFTADRQIMDEAYDLPDLQLEAMMPTLAARPDTQLVFTSSAGMAESATLRRIRQRALDGDRTRFAYLEWSVDPKDFDPTSEADWAFANPGYGIRIGRDAVENEQAMMTEAGFARERLGIWDEESAASAFDLAAYEACLSDDAAPSGRLTFAVDAAPDGASAAIVASDGAAVEVIAYRPGLGWVLDEVERLSRTYHAEVVFDPAGPIGALAPRMTAALKSKARPVTARDLTNACGGFAQALTDGLVTIRRNADLTAGVRSSRRRELGDAWAIRRAMGGADICVVVAALEAFWGATRKREVNLLDQIF